MRTEELIVQLARDGGPVRLLAAPSVRFARWTAAAVPAAALGAIVIGPRPDVMNVIQQPTFVGLAAVTLATALLSAAGAFVLSVPGVERSPLQRALPLVAGTVWTLLLVVLITDGGDSVRRVLAFPIHWLCIIEIAAFGLLAGWPLFAMLRRAAPLRRAWSAALAALAATALGAAATQFLCPIDDPAHQLVGHLLPVVLLSAWATISGRRWLEWRRGR